MWFPRCQSAARSCHLHLLARYRGKCQKLGTNPTLGENPKKLGRASLFQIPNKDHHTHHCEPVTVNVPCWRLPATFTMPIMRKTRVLIADESPVARGRIRTLVKSRPDIEVAGEAASEAEALSKASALNPDVVLVNMRSIPQTAWLDFVQRLARESPTLRAVLTALPDDAEHLSSLLETVVSMRDQSANRERLTITLSLRRDATLPITGLPAKFQTVQMAAAAKPSSVTGSPLSSRERQVLLLLAEGHSNREIAKMIFRSVKTVEAHRANIKKKLGLRNRADIVSYVRAAGLRRNRTA